MSESKEHRELILRMAENIGSKFPKMNVIKDAQDKPGDEIPPNIDEHKPDIYAFDKLRRFYIVGEAKTREDLDNDHTRSQLNSFTSFLENKNQGLLILGVPGEMADRAKTLLAFFSREIELTTTKFQVFDSLDYWEIDLSGRPKWHLI